LPELVKINKAFAASRTPGKARNLDTRWHETLISQSKNDRLASILSMLRQRIRRYEHLYMADIELIPISAQQHDAIIGSIRKRNLKELLKAVKMNYRFGMQILLRKMEEE
jgi:DNA-binding GntR family transcriptional regulator